MPRPHALDVADFHRRFAVPFGTHPHLLAEADMGFRLQFLEEELEELKAAYEASDLEGVADALVDLVYVAIGTALWMGLPWQELWDEVHAANMRKVPARRAGASKRGHQCDVVKPEGWRPPDIRAVLLRAVLEPRRVLDQLPRQT